MFHSSTLHFKQIKIGPLHIPIPIGRYGLSAGGIIALGIGIRIALLVQGWPHTNADEGVLGQMAMNIAFHGDHPLFLYGQNYMGTTQAYLGALLFHLFGVSLFSLRLGLVILFTLFLISMYVLTSLLFSKKLALFTVFLLCLGSNYVIYREVQALGGWVETLFFCALMFILASWLALTSGQEAIPTRRRTRLAAFFVWGTLVGISLWSTIVIAPYIFMMGLLLLVFCWRELRSWALFYLLLGLLLGGLPMIYYNLHAGHGADSLTTVLFIFHGGAAHGSIRQLLLKGITSVWLISLPAITGNSWVCDTSSTLLLGGSGPGAFQCTIAQASWSLVWIVLWISSFYLALKTIWKVPYKTPAAMRTFEQRADLVRSCTRLALLIAAGMSVLLFAASPTSTYFPFLSSRYLIFIMIATPALIYPLWEGASIVRKSVGRFARIVQVDAKRLALLVIALLLLWGTVKTFGEIPVTQAENAHQEALVQHLLQIGARHIYSDFWSCDRIIFQSYEQIRCSVVGNNLRPAGDRYKPNGVIVQADPMSSYVFPIGSPQAKAIAHRSANVVRQYRYYVFNGYIVYQPIEVEPH